MRAYWAVIVVLAACGNPAGTGADAMIGGGGSDGAMTDAGDGWTTLVERTWTQAPASEAFKCRRIRIDQDMYISSFRTIAPPGTHHEMVSITTTSTNVGDYDCNPGALDSTSNPMMLFGAGIGTPDFNFPPGVAIKLPAGTYIQLYIHVFNASDASMTATSGVQVKLANPADVLHEADMMLGGRYAFTAIPSDGQPHDVVADCGFPDVIHVVGMWPHMHEYGTHQNITARRAGVVVQTLLDTDYDFNDQRTFAMDIPVAASDRLSFICTFVNNSGVPIGPSDGASGEMCLTGFYKWPVGGPYDYCVNKTPL